MTTKKQIQPGEKVPLKLTATERKLVLEDLLCLDEEYEQVIQGTPTGKPVMMTLDELDDFCGYIAAEANHCDDKKKEQKLDAVFGKIQDLLEKYTDEEPPQIIKIEDAKLGLTESKPSKKPQAKAKVASAVLYQFKITLTDSQPAIWRRIQVQDCTLDKLHEHIQTATGWTNSHLHVFEIKGQRYGDPELLQDGFEELCADSTTTMVSGIVPTTSKRFVFKYEYDFGDGWEHEVLFEGCPPVKKGKKYPICLEGERACPPEDVGGVWGYQDFLTAIADPDHEEHENFLEWCGGSFSPDEFDPKKATREMKKSLPDWRRMR
jgi:hypothetical protein